MILAAMIGYYIFAIGALLLVGYITAQQNFRQFKARADAMITHLNCFRESEHADKPSVISESSSEGVPFRISLRKTSESEGRKLPAMAAVLIHYIRQLDQELGGQGVTFAGASQTQQYLTLRLVMKPVGDVSSHMNFIIRELCKLTEKARQGVVTEQEADLEAKIEAELASPYSPDLREAAELLEPIGV